MTVSIMKNSHVAVVVNDNIRIMVMLHRVWKRHPVHVDFLGVYIHDDNQYSPLVHGLIGVLLFSSEELPEKEYLCQFPSLISTKPTK